MDSLPLAMLEPGTSESLLEHFHEEGLTMGSYVIKFLKYKLISIDIYWKTI